MDSCFDSLSQDRHQFRDVYTGSAIDIWRVLLGNEIHTHTQMLVRASR